MYLFGHCLGLTLCLEHPYKDGRQPSARRLSKVALMFEPHFAQRSNPAKTWMFFLT